MMSCGLLIDTPSLHHSRKPDAMPRHGKGSASLAVRQNSRDCQIAAHRWDFELRSGNVDGEYRESRSRFDVDARWEAARERTAGGPLGEKRARLQPPRAADGLPMTQHDDTPITLSREDLYELVWSKPMRELAKDFRISDVALAKRCRKLGIPLPGRGYWARVDAGQAPYMPKLPEREPQWFDDGALTVAPSVGAYGHDSDVFSGDEGFCAESELQQRVADDAWLQKQLAYEESSEHTIDVPASTRRWDPVIQSCREDLEEAAEAMRTSRKASDRYDKWPEWRKRKEIDSAAWGWRSAKDRGQRIGDTHEAVAFRVSLDTYDRALRLINAVALAARDPGFSVRDDDENGRIVLAGHDAEVQFRIAEILEEKTRTRVRYDGKTEQEKFKVPTGGLRITLQTGYSDGPSFTDTAALPLEQLLNQVFRSVYRQVLRAWKQDREHRAFHRRLEEDARRAVEEARLKAERERTLAEERARKRHLSREASRWSQSKRIREYVNHVRERALNCRGSADELADWSTWALRIASELDPTGERLTSSAAF